MKNVGPRPPSAAGSTKTESAFAADKSAAEAVPGMNGPQSTLTSLAQPARKSRLWLWFVLAFILQLGAWVAWFTIANQHRVETVPLATAGAPK